MALEGYSYSRTLTLSAALTASLILPLLPLLLNGAPYIGDSWVHLKIAEETVKSGYYRLDEYNERWPLVNLIPVFLTLLTDVSEFHTEQVVPLLAGLATVPFYCICRRLGLSRGASVFSIFFLNFNPLYSYITFTAVVMKETATYLLFMISILLLFTAATEESRPSRAAASILAGLGVVLGHHYASLILLIFIWMYAFYALIYRLKGEPSSPRMAMGLGVVYTIIFSIWNVSNHLALSGRFPSFNASDVMILSALIIVVGYSLLKDKGFFSGKLPWLACAAYVIVLLGLRGGQYLLAQPVPAVSLGEMSNYIVAGVTAIIGLAIGLRRFALKAYAASVVSMSLFAFLWGVTYFGFVLMVKSLHYLGPLMAIGGGFTVSAMSGRQKTFKVLNKLVSASLVFFLIYASSRGNVLALKGLSAYDKGEVESAITLGGLNRLNVIGDTRVSYLLTYLSGQSVSGLNPMGVLSSGYLLVLTKKNRDQGFLMGYDWMVKDAVIDIELADEHCLAYNSGFLQAWLT